MSEKTINDFIKLPVQKYVWDERTNPFYVGSVLDNDGRSVCRVVRFDDGNDTNRLRFIIEAINSHSANLERVARLEKEKAELIEALEKVLKSYDDYANYEIVHLEAQRVLTKL